jgi:enoyl-CoA hydratase
MVVWWPSLAPGRKRLLLHWRRCSCLYIGMKARPLALSDSHRCCRGSPLSQKVTLRALRAARGQRLGPVLQMDFRIVVRMVAGPSDFQEGVRSTLIDRSGQPHWSPATLEEVDPPPSA